MHVVKEDGSTVVMPWVIITNKKCIFRNERIDFFAKIKKNIKISCKKDMSRG